MQTLVGKSVGSRETVTVKTDTRGVPMLGQAASTEEGTNGEKEEMEEMEEF